jgi:hypothetical protein
MKYFMLFFCLCSLLLSPLAFCQITPDSDYSIVEIKIIPQQATMKVGEKVHFQFIGIDGHGNKIPVAFQWRFGGGSLTWDGYYTAGNRPGDYEIEAIIPTTGLSAKAKIHILPERNVVRYLDRVEITPNFVTLTPGEKTKFQFAAYDNLGDKMSVAMSMRYSGGEMLSSGEYTAGDKPGEYSIEVSTQEGRTATAKIVIADHSAHKSSYWENKSFEENKHHHHHPHISHKTTISVEPAQVSLSPNQECNFTVTLKNEFNETVEKEYSIEVGGGTLTSDGATYTAGNVPGNYRYTVKLPTGETAYADITIKPDPTKHPHHSHHPMKPKQSNAEPVYLEVTPANIQLKSGEQQTFTIKAYDIYHNQTSLQGCSIQFNGGTLSSDGKTYTAGSKEGRFYYAVTMGKLEARANITIINPYAVKMPADRGKIATLEIEPKKVRVAPSGQCKFKVIAKDRYGNPANATISWSYRGGRMQPDGTFTANYLPSQNLVIARSGDLEARAIVAIVPTNVAINSFLWIELTPMQVKLRPGEQCKIECKITNDDGYPVRPRIKWECTGGTFDPYTMTYTAGKEYGDFYVEAIVNDYVRARVSIEILL